MTVEINAPADGNMLLTMNLSGNVHGACDWINERLPELVDALVSIEYTGGHYSVVVFRAPAALITRLKAERRI